MNDNCNKIGENMNNSLERLSLLEIRSSLTVNLCSIRSKSPNEISVQIIQI